VRNAEVDAERITVEVQGSKPVLEGHKAPPRKRWGLALRLPNVIEVASLKFWQGSRVREFEGSPLRASS
jgi:hypothetical protein